MQCGRRSLLRAATTTGCPRPAPCRRLELQAFSSSLSASQNYNSLDEPASPTRHVQKSRKDKPGSSSSQKSNKEMSEQKVYRATQKVVDKATQRTPERHGWSHTKRLRGEENRLKGAVESGQALKLERRRDYANSHGGKDKRMRFREHKVASTPKSRPLAHFPSLEKQAFTAKDEMQEFSEEQMMTYPVGTFVETRRNNTVSHGVVIGEEYYMGRVCCTCLMTSGEVWSPNAYDIYFSIPSLVPTDLATRCGSQEITEIKSELHARVEALRRIRVVERALENAYSVVSSRAPALYEKLRHSDPEMWSTTTVEQAAKLIDNEPSLIMTFATHKFLMNNSARFVADQDYRLSRNFRVAPLSHVKDIEAVEEWMRIKKGGPLDSFAEKARAIIVENAKRLEDAFVGPPIGRPAHHAWDANDKLILRFLTRALRPTRTNQADPYTVPQSAILKLLNFDSLTVGDVELQRALVGLGVLAPWQDLMVAQSQFDLDLEPENKSERLKEQNALVRRSIDKAEKAVTTASQTQGPLGPEDFYPTDPLESVRHDFGDMKVYVVDDTTAQELDDGISIERIPSEPGCIWLHVHIADPGSVIPPTHALAIEARKQQETAYFFPRTWPLFPRSLVHSPVHGLSLGSKSEQGIPDRVLTFSAKLDQRGNILNYKVRAGLVRNIKVVDYDSVDRALGALFESNYPFGKMPTAGGEQNNPSLTEEEIQDFRDLLTFAKTLILECGKNESYLIREERFSLKGLSNSMPQDLPLRPAVESPYEFSGFPSMEYEVQNGVGTDVGSRSIIAEAAKIACRIASRFALDHGNIPLLRRHVPRFVANSPEDLGRLLDLRTPTGFVENWQAAKYISLNPPSIYTLLPKEHFGLCIPDGEGYVRATSPLRRYNDLMAHWQLHHALLGNRATSATPPFSESDMEEYKLALMSSDRQRRVTQKLHERYWQILFIQRWIEGTRLGKIDPDKVEGGDPIKRLSGRLLGQTILDSQTRTYRAELHIPLLGLRGVLELPDARRDAEIGTLFNLKVKELRLGVRPQISLQVKD